MNRTNVIHLLEKKINREYIIEDEMMNKHTTFKVGGPADLYVIPRSEEELVYAIEVCKSENVPYYVIGNGSNLLVTDKGFRGVIIEVYRQMSDITVEGNCITAYAGALLSKIANTALEHGLTGLEFAHGIPGALGGAVTMNAGAYDGEMKQVLESATVIDDKGQVRTLSEGGDKEAISAKMKDLMQRRRDKQPLEYPSAGSTFKRPVGHFAGKLIMDAGLRGYQLGGAQVSEKHCGFVINKDHATCQDILDLIHYIQEEVKSKFDVQIEPEVKMIGER